MHIDKYLDIFFDYLNVNVSPEKCKKDLYYGGLSEKAPKEARKAYEKSKKIYMDALKKGIKL